MATIKLQPVLTILPLIRLSLPEFLLQYLQTAILDGNAGECGMTDLLIRIALVYVLYRQL